MADVVFRTLREPERHAFLELMDVAFVDEDVALFARYLDEDPLLGCDDTLVAMEGGRLVSSVQIFTRTIRLRGQPVKLGGIGSVATHPEREGRGLASELLRRAIVEMRSRGMALSLLFTGRISFYERLGWVRVDHPVDVVRTSDEPEARVGRAFGPEDLAGVERVYQSYCGARDGTTVRDAVYWRGQLRFAGEPDETFRVVERDGSIVAYARRITFMNLPRIMEMGSLPDDTEALARLLVTLVPSGRGLCVPTVDPALGESLAGHGAELERIAFPGQMWRVLDRERLADLVPGSESLDDEALLRALVTPPGFVFWPSDRF